MNAPQGPAAPASGSCDDPEIAALLEFEPVPRKRDVDGGWTAELQRTFIAMLAAHGSPGRVCDELGKDQTGVMKLYRSPLGASFRSAWDGAVELAKRRRAEESRAELVRPGTRPPTLDHRRKHHQAHGREPEPDNNEHGLPIDEDQKWDLIHNIGVKFMRKVAAEREARLAGEIVAADFYLRQITFLEVIFDLTATNFGWDAREVLGQLRRGEHKLWEIVDTPLADWLDRSRRLWWAEEGEPERPPYPDVRFLERHRSADGDYTTNVDQEATGALTTPARGYTAEEWARMTNEEQRIARQKQFDEDAVAQAHWERRAYEEWRAQSVRGTDEHDIQARQSAPPVSARDGEGRGQ